MNSLGRRMAGALLMLTLVSACGPRLPTETATAAPLGEPVSDTQSQRMVHTGTFALAHDWPQRDCSATVRYKGAGARRVQLTGELAGGAAALDLSEQRDGVFELTLEPGSGRQSGQRYGYRLLADGLAVWNPAASRFSYDGKCVVAALQMPDCASRPEILVNSFDARYQRGTGNMNATLALLGATDSVGLQEASLALDGRGVDPHTVLLDATAGTLQVAIDRLPPGKHVLSVRLTDQAGRAAEPVDLPFWIEAEEFDWRDAILYMVVVDRFANGDRDSDRKEGGSVQWPADFHGGDLQGLAEVIRSGYFAQIGIRAIWLSPINQQAEGHFLGRDKTRQYAGYHGYWPSRGRSVEPRFGGNAALRTVVDEAHKRGIRVLLDLIGNQVHDQHEYLADNPQWFRKACVCGIDEACGWSERPYDCLFNEYLPDIDWTVPKAEQQFINDALFWIAEFGIDGFRIDAVKHVEPNSIFNLRAEVARRFEQGGATVFMAGETAVSKDDSSPGICDAFQFASGYEWVDGYVGKNALNGQFDFPTHHRIKGMAADELSYVDVEAAMRDAETRYKPEGLHVQFLGTHDSYRLASAAAEDPALECKWADDAKRCATMPQAPGQERAYQRLKRAFTVLWTMPGIPFLYYGDEIAMPGGGDPDNRRDMVWSGELARLAMGETSLNAKQRGLRDWISALGQARRNSPALRRGTRLPLLVEGDAYVYAWTHGQSAALVLVNRGDEALERAVDLPEGLAAEFHAVVGNGRANANGSTVHVWVGAGEASVLLNH